AVEILPDGTIIAGHQRVRAATKLGWTEIRCWVRNDLAEAGDEAIEVRLIQDNVNRRQLGLIGQIRCYARLKELLQGGRAAHSVPAGDARDQLAQRFRKSGRTLDRLARILKTPPEVQQAVDAGRLQVVAASKVAGLDDGVQKKIARRIRSGEDPNQVVNEALGKDGDAVGETWALTSLGPSTRIKHNLNLGIPASTTLRTGRSYAVSPP
ncbi:MAG: ParB/RepB/Spo0J family partition protein, partial [Planctomycetota bacterium]